ncbi:hypothetical protein GCM10009853_020390 [Glycomyces scopariae]
MSTAPSAAPSKGGCDRMGRSYAPHAPVGNRERARRRRRGTTEVGKAGGGAAGRSKAGAVLGREKTARLAAGGPGGSPAVGWPGPRVGQAQDTEGQFQLPLAWMVRPKLLPAPFGVATSCCADG